MGWEDDITNREPKTETDPNRAWPKQWFPAALDRLLADVQASPATTEIDRYALAKMTEKYAASQLVIHGLRSQINGLRADLTISERTCAVLRAQVVQMSRPWWRKAWACLAEFVAVIGRARG
jgi:hypothetical protein